MNTQLLKHKFQRLGKAIYTFAKWSAIALLVGVVTGFVGIAFSYAIKYASVTRSEYSWLKYLLPLGGLLIVLIYKLTNSLDDKGTNQVFSTIHAKSELPLKMAPLIFVSTAITHLLGGSAGREGASIQIGGSIGNQLGKWFRFDDRDRRVVVMCSMSAAFSAVFGTPVAAAVFSMEVVSVGVMYYAALVPCVFASTSAYYLAVWCGVEHDRFSLINIPGADVLVYLKIVLLAAVCAAVSVLFCVLLHNCSKWFAKLISNEFIRIFCGGSVVVLLSIVFMTNDYLGAGMPMIEAAVGGNTVWYAFLLKILFTVVTLACGYKGGEIVPSFFIGATLGCLFGSLCGISPSLCAGLGMVAVFCGVTNCPLTSLFIGLELFGYNCGSYIMVAVAVSYMLSGYYGLYSDQTIVYSKYKTKLINKQTRN